MLATLIMVKNSSGSQYWYRNSIGKQFWVTMRYDAQWYGCVLDPQNLFPTNLNGIDYDIIGEADIDVVSTIRVNKMITKSYNTSSAFVDIPVFLEYNDPQ
jgi:hypothetical protein